MNITKILVAMAIAFTVQLAPALAEKHAACCEKAKAAGKECEHKCCVEAKKEKKDCEKCSKPKES